MYLTCLAVHVNIRQIVIFIPGTTFIGKAEQHLPLLVHFVYYAFMLVADIETSSCHLHLTYMSYRVCGIYLLITHGIYELGHGERHIDTLAEFHLDIVECHVHAGIPAAAHPESRNAGQR